jgi:hypothetical protein
MYTALVSTGGKYHVNAELYTRGGVKEREREREGEGEKKVTRPIVIDQFVM